MTTDDADDLTPEPLRPLFAWAGVKTWLGPRLQKMTAPYLPAARVVEPFGGALGVGLYLQPKRALINDYSKHLIGLYKEIQAGHYPNIPLATTRDEWWAQREALNDLCAKGVQSGPYFAALVFAVMRGVFRGFFKTNADGRITQGGTTPSRKDIPDWEAYRRVFQGWEFQQGDWKKVKTRPDDLIIADPPYYGTWADYSADKFPIISQFAVVQRLLKHPGPFILNNDQRIAANYLEWGLDCALLPRETKDGKRIEAVEVIAVQGVEMPEDAERLDLPTLLRLKADLIEADWAKEAERKQATRERAKTKRAAKKATPKRATKKRGAK